MLKFGAVCNFVLIFVGLWFATLFSYQYQYDLPWLNLSVCAVILLIYNFNRLSWQKYCVFLLSVILVLLLGLFSSAHTWGNLLFLGLIGETCFLQRHHLKTKNIVFLIIFMAAFFHLSFISETKINDVQYDITSCYNYIEYILDNNFSFWKENPLLTRPSYSTYHPILHFYLAAVVHRIGTALSFSLQAADEGMQILFLAYMTWYGIIAARILELLKVNKLVFLSCLVLVLCFPIYFAVSGFLNNDCLLLPLQAGTIYYSLRYYQNGGRKNLFYIFVFATLATLTKLSGILVLPMTAFCLLLRLYQQKNMQTFCDIVIFGVFLMLGISLWPLWQHFGLGVSDATYVPPQAHLGLSSYGLWERLNPLKAFSYEQMFYNDYGVNLWETMTKTALFGQWDFSIRGAEIMSLIKWQIVIYKIIIALLIVAIFYLCFRSKNKDLFALTMILLLSLILGIVAFSFIHPYMCNQDFRYVAILPLVMAMIFALALEQLPKLTQVLGAFLFVLFAFISAFIWCWVVL